MKNEIKAGSRVQINVGSKFARGIVKSVADYSIGDNQNLYIEMNDEDTGEYHYWKQDLDGGSVELLDNKAKVVKAVRIEPVNYMSSKEEEIKTLEKIQKIALNGSFLAELFTDSMIAWVKGMIKSDNMPNLFDRFVNQTSEIAHYHQRVEEAEKHVEEMRDIKNLKIEDLQNRLNQLSEKKDEEYRLVIENLKGEIKSLEDRLDIASSASIKYYQEREELSDLISQDQQKNHELWLTVQDRNLEILKLKAHIYDLEHKEG